MALLLRFKDLHSTQNNKKALLNLAYKLGNAKFRCPEGKAKKN